MFLLDTDHVVILQRESTQLCQALLARMSAYAPDAFFISIVTFHEQVAGWQSYLNRKRDAASVVHAYAEFSRLLTIYSDAQLAAFDQAAADIFDSLRRQRVRIGTMDLRIASTALARDFTVLSRNLVDFEKIPGLRIEDWTVNVPERPR